MSQSPNKPTKRLFESRVISQPDDNGNRKVLFSVNDEFAVNQEHAERITLMRAATADNTNMGEVESAEVIVRFFH